MFRMGVALLALIALVGCRAPGFDPLGLSGPTRVPPPPTGTIGDLSNGYYAPVPRPALNTGAANWPTTDFAPARDSGIAAGISSPVASRSQLPSVASNDRAADTKPSLQPNDGLNWLDPAARYGQSTYEQSPYGASGSNGYVADRGRAYAPRLLPAPGATQPIVSAPPRIRGFPNTGRQNLYVPPELAQFRSDGVRQASVNSQWQPRYDDMRR